MKHIQDLAAVQKNGWAIQYLTDEQRTPEICLAAVKQRASSILYIADAQRTPEVCLAAVKKFGNVIHYLTDAQRTPEILDAVPSVYRLSLEHYVRYYPDDMIGIGDLIFSRKQWASFTDEQIEVMGIEDYWKLCKEAILTYYP